ncbi:helix-turn-helix domain-containing protein [Alkalicoccobacillus porphyridii]|nr:helix-turn-helix domain-containing protein [Alkalicoccobacillus porphyridii]
MAFGNLRSKLLYKYIISYLLIFLVPFTIMSVVIYLNAVSSLREEIENSNVYNLEQVKNLTEERLSELDTIAARISFDPRLTPYMVSHGYYSGEATDELRKYKANSAIIEELFIYYNNNETLYSTNGSYSIDALVQNSYQIERLGKENLLNDLSTKIPLLRAVDDVVINEETHENLVVYFAPIAPNSEKPHGTVMFFIEESTIINMIRNILGEIEGNVYVFNEDGQTIASTTSDDSVSTADISSLVNGRTGVSSVQIEGKDYSTVSVQSEVSGWTFITVMDPNQFFGKLFNMQLIITSFLIGMFIVGLILAVLFGKNQYKPIQDLFNIANKGEKQPQLFKGENELETIGKSFATLYEDHELLNETVDLHQPFAREQFLVRLLKGSYKSSDEIQSMMETLNLSFMEGNYFVAIVNFDTGTFCEENINEKDNIIRVISNLSIDQATAYGVDLLYSDSIAIVIGIAFEANDENKHREEVIQVIQTHFEEYFVQVPTIGVGQPYNKTSMINRSYIEALATVEYKFSKPQGSIIYFEDIGTESKHLLGYLKEEQVKYVQSLKQGDHTVATEMLTDMFDAMASRELSINEIKCICFDIINTTLKTVSELGFDKHIPDFNQLIDFKSMDQLHTELQNVVDVICEEVEVKKDSHNIKLRDEILTYIQSNYRKYEISLESVAQEFYLSVSYLSRFIKEQTGETFTQFIQNLRIQYVKEQLTETDEAIKDIVVQVGYKDVANFIRKFKKIEGVTPGQYRKLHKS